MNSTIEKFGYPATLVKAYDHWLVLVRPAQVTLGSLVMAARSDATAYADLPAAAFTEQARVVADIEQALAAFTAFERINYLMLMMVDPHVHCHVIPRYSSSRRWRGRDFVDNGWPGVPQLASAEALSDDDIAQMVGDLAVKFR
ncbi:MAG: HIT family protein [Sphingomicrobium sp.]